MKAKELVEKIYGRNCGFASDEEVDAARAAFLANLTEALGVKFPEGIWVKNDTLRAKALFYAGVVTGLQGEITEDAIKDAHLAMVFPSNRAVISRLLYGQGDVTHWGVPASYNA